MTEHNVKSDNHTKRPAAAQATGPSVEEKPPVNQTRFDAPHVVAPSSVEIESHETISDVGEPSGGGETGLRLDKSVGEDAVNSNTAADILNEGIKDGTKNSGICPPASRQPGMADEQLRQQAAQLAEQLRRRQRELDHREARLNARVAQLENDSRAARLWLTENRQALDARQDELLREDQRLQGRQKKLSEAEAAIAERAEQLDRQTKCLRRQSEELYDARRQFELQQKNVQDQLDAQRQRLDVRRQASLALVRQLLSGLERRRGQLEDKAERLRKNASQPGKELLAREEKTRAEAKQYRRRMRQLLAAEATLAAEQSEVNQLRQRLLAEREELDRRDRLRRQQAAADRGKMQAEMDEKRSRLARRSEELDREENALRQIREELNEMYRSGLEMRLAVEELWVQLSGTVPPAALTQSLGQIRARLAEHYRSEKSELSAQKRELVALGAELAEQHKLIARQKKELDAWIARRRQEIEQQAAHLVAREQQLLEQETSLERTSGEWAMQRLAYQQQIRELRERLDELAESGKISSGMCGVF